MSIQILKLVNGDDIISNAEENSDMKIMFLNNPAKLMMIPTDEGTMGMMLVPWCPYISETQFEISTDHIILVIEEEDVPEEIRNDYSNKFGSGIVTPPKGLII